MRQTELFGRIRSYAAMVVMVVVAMLSAGCGSDDEVPAGEFYVGPDKDGWYTFYDKYSVYEGVVYAADEEWAVIDAWEPLWLRVSCLNLTNKDCVKGDDVMFRILKFKMVESQTWDHGKDIIADVKLFIVEKQ